MYASIERVFEEANQNLQRERRRLELLQQSAQELGSYDQDGFAAMGRALSYVVMGGVLENLMRDLPSAIAADLVALRISRSRLPIGLLSVLDAAHFRRCSGDTVQALIARASLLRSASNHATDGRLVENFSDLLKLADGSTVGSKNFEALWMLFDMPGDWRNIPQDLLLVQEITAKRNDVAHWLQDPVEVGRSKRPSALIKMVDQLTQLLDHVLLSLCYWFEDRLTQ
ncbi:hypothetical protein FE391_20170 [Nonomuraea sp. KC401]|uniref:hypothetical protein n=1 Tax=unclassified Nonomuraea TaxID=2593643 RepID=UPI0010FF625E|nr:MULTISPECIES: hypothetical protein [unclassified Nonomuraea]NBE95197.1 hypothetical protein [Nonomuraea sp. K271]TLF71172.1 hypothetical protein FE391_20170 [Nonomuraea sp. KC401]